MSSVQVHSTTVSSDDAGQIGEAAMGSYSRLLGAVGTRLLLHVAPGGELICEDSTVSARPTLWRIARDGTVLPDSPYSFSRRAFVAAALPASV